jgi:hypothetical protein
MSQLKSDTSRANGAKSHGPKSAETRAISSQNALRHGLTACHTTVLKCENRDEFENAIQHYFSTYHPADDEQEALVNEMISARWRIRRLRIVETQLINLEMIRNQAEIEKKYGQTDGCTQLTEAMSNLMEDVHSLALITRYESRLFRMHDRCYRILRELRRTGDRSPHGIQPAQSVETEPQPPLPAGITLVPAPAEPEEKNDQTNPPAAALSRCLPSSRTPQPHDFARILMPRFVPRRRARLTASQLLRRQ